MQQHINDLYKTARTKRVWDAEHGVALWEGAVLQGLTHEDGLPLSEAARYMDGFFDPYGGHLSWSLPGGVKTVLVFDDSYGGGMFSFYLQYA